MTESPMELRLDEIIATLNPRDRAVITNLRLGIRGYRSAYQYELDRFCKLREFFHRYQRFVKHVTREK